MTPTDRQIAEVERRLDRLEVLVRQLQGIPAPVSTLEFQFSAATTEPPTGSQIRINSASFTTATKVWIRYTPTTGGDAYRALARVRKGSTFYLQDYDDHTNYVTYETTDDAIDKDTYVELPVKWVASGGPLPGQKIVLVLRAARG